MFNSIFNAKFNIVFAATAVALIIAGAVGVFAQDAPTLEDALAAVRAEYGEDVAIIEAELEDEGGACWEMAIISGGAVEEICVAADGTITQDVEDDDATEADDEDDGEDGEMDDKGEEAELTEIPEGAMTIDAVIAQIASSNPDSAIIGLELELENDMLIWEVALDSGEEITLDGETGDVISTEMNNDGDSEMEDTENGEDGEDDDDDGGSRANDDNDDDGEDDEDD